MKHLLSRLLTSISLAAPLFLLAETTPPDISLRVVGGIESDATHWPSIVSLKGKNTNRHFCGATLIADQWVLTAAHCMFESQRSPLSASNITATVGEYDLASSPITPATNIERIVVHPHYDPIGEINDIALLKLAQKSSSERTSILNLQDTLTLIENAAPATVIGWGSTVAYNPGQVVDATAPKILREVEVPLNSDQQCRASLGANYTNEMLCAGFPQGGKDSCQGDSGGPLMVNSNYGWQQIGIVSWGIGCAAIGKPGVYTRLALYSDWINSITKTFSSTANIEFLLTPVNDSDVKAITIDNNFSSDANFTYKIEGSKYFTFDNSSCMTIAAHSSCQLAVAYAPLDRFPHKATITINSNIPESVQQKSQLYGVPLLISSSSGSLGLSILLLIPLIFIRRYRR